MQLTLLQTRDEKVTAPSRIRYTVVTKPRWKPEARSRALHVSWCMQALQALSSGSATDSLCCACFCIHKTSTMMSTCIITAPCLQHLQRGSPAGQHDSSRAFTPQTGRRAWNKRHNRLCCRADDRSSVTTDIRKIDTEKGGTSLPADHSRI